MSAVLTGSTVASGDVTVMGGLLSDTINALVSVMYSLIDTLVKIFTTPAVIGSIAVLLVIMFVYRFFRTRLANKI